MTTQEIVNKVRGIMNEAGEEENLHLLGEDTLKLDAYIQAVIPDAIKLILLSSPLQFINTTSGAVSVQNDNGIGIINLPDDFLRLAAVKLKEWKRSVFFVHPSVSQEYKIQHNPVTRSGVNKPSCVMGYSSSGASIECFPSGTLEYFHYVRSSGDLDQIKENLLPSVCYMCASLVYDIFEMPQPSEKMKSIAIELIPK